MLEGWLRDHGTLEAAAASHPEAEPLTGRGRVYSVPAPVPSPDGARESGPGERWVVRHYHRGGAIAPILGDRYLRVGTPRPLRELEVGREAEARGIPTPVHLAAAVYPSGIWYRGDLVTRHVPDSRDLAAVLFPGRSLGSRPLARSGSRPDGTGRRADPRAAVEATGRLFRTLHEAGVNHPDLNLKNVLIAGAGPEVQALVLDLDGARLGDGVGDADRRRMISRFWRSARKWQRATGIALDPEVEAAFRAGYETDTGRDAARDR